MIRRFISLAAVALALLGLGLPDGQRAAAQETYLEGPEAGRELAEQLRDLAPEGNSQWRGALNNKPRGGQTQVIPITCQVVAGGTQWKVIYTTSAAGSQGAEQLTVIHSTNAPNQYLYARAPAPGEPLGKPETLTGSAADISFAGSDFWLSELGFEFYHWPQQARLKGQMRRGQPCYVLESINPLAKPGGLARVVTFIEKESGQPILAEAYAPDNDKRPLKEFSLGKVAKVNGRWQPKNMEISNRKTGSRTTLEFDLDEK